MGSIFKQQYHVKDKDGRVHKRSSKKWYVAIKRGGKWIRKPAYVDKSASMHMLVRLEREAALEAEGVFDHLTPEIGRPIAEHVADFIQHLHDKRNTPLHCKGTETMVTRIIELGKIGTGPQITKSRVEAALAILRDPEQTARPLSTATANHYLTAIKHFAQWLVDERRARESLIAGMKKRSVEGERVMERRPLTPSEFAALIEAAKVGKAWVEKGRSISGADRVALYTLASFTGYRRRELSSITPAAFTFGAEPCLNVVRGYSKRKKAERIPIKRDVAAHFERYIAKRPKGEPLWPVAKLHTAEMIRADMDAAGVSHKAGIVVVDFHSLRQTFTTGLARSGASPKVTQQLARHSDVNLTMSVYTKMNDADERAAVEALPTPEHLTQRLTKSDARQRKPSKDSRAESGRPQSSAARKKRTK
jgi:integrase/recombinase XerC